MEEIKPHNIIIGQRIEEKKIILARQLRRKMTPTEIILWGRLRRDGLGINFRRQQIIDGFIADFYCHRAALVIEVDGAAHDADYDAERDQVFAARGITVLRFTNSQVAETMGFVLSRIRRHLHDMNF